MPKLTRPHLTSYRTKRPAAKAKACGDPPIAPPPVPPKAFYNFSEPSLHCPFIYGSEPEWAFDREPNEYA